MVCKSVESLTALTRSRAQVLQVRKVILRHLRHHARKVLHGCKAIHVTEGIVRAKSYMSVMSFTEHGFTALAGLCAPDILDLKLYAALTQLCTHHSTFKMIKYDNFFEKWYFSSNVIFLCKIYRRIRT